MKRDLPDGDVDPPAGATGMGALWRSDKKGHEGLVRFNNFEDYEDYEVEVYMLAEDGETVISDREYWTDDAIKEFVNSSETAYLSGHNLPGSGHYGVFVDGARPNCPECGAFMSPGEPMFHESASFAIGFTCKKYGRTNGGHAGYMTQEEAIEQGYYITIEEYLKRRYGGEKA